MCKLKRFLSQNILRILYNSLILPRLQFCVLSWGSISDIMLTLQKRAVRIITCSKYNAHSEPLLKTLNLLQSKISWTQKHWNCIIGTNEINFKNIWINFTESNDNHSYDTRYKSLLYQLPTMTNTGWLCIRHCIPELLTKTPECITEKLDTHSFSGISNYMKN